MRIAVPNKGRLHEPTMDLLERAGLHVEETADRQLYADTVDPDVSVLFARAADVPEYVADGAADLGVTGLDQARESGQDLADLLDLGFGRCRLVLAAPEDGDIAEPDDVEGLTIATEFPRVTRNYLDERGVDAEVVEVTGATELTPHVEMADAIVDITSTGTTLQVNRLAVVDEVLASSVRLFARPNVADDPKVREVETAFSSVIAADGKRYLMMNAPSDRLDDVKDVIPGMGGPTVMDVADSPEPATDSAEVDARGGDGNSAEVDARGGDGNSAEVEGEEDHVAVHVVVDERDVFGVISDLQAVGATDILVTEIERLVE